jgi:hypothetical protein
MTAALEPRETQTSRPAVGQRIKELVMIKRDIVKVIRPGKSGLPPRASGMIGPLPHHKPKKPVIPAAGIMGPRPPKHHKP